MRVAEASIEMLQRVNKEGANQIQRQVTRVLFQTLR
jgi:hypothetical protein